jgi:hypothetical protein
MESRNGIHTVEHGAAIGFGSRTYKLKNVSLTSMEEKEVSTVYIYPNPATSAVQIPNHTNYDFISIFDMNGREVAKYKSESALSVQSIKQGMYVVQFKNKGKVIGVSTLLKKE